MDKRYRLLQHLYGELEQSDLPQEILNDERLRAEYLGLRETKELLDQHHQYVAPDPEVVNRIVKASSRPRIRRIVGWPVVWKSMAAAAAIAGIVILSSLPEQTGEAPAQSAAPAQVTWDEASSLVDIHSRIEMLNARSHTSLWDDEDVLSLDSVVLGVQNGFNAVSTR